MSVSMVPTARQDMAFATERQGLMLGLSGASSFGDSGPKKGCCVGSHPT